MEKNLFSRVISFLYLRLALFRIREPYADFDIATRAFLQCLRGRETNTRTPAARNMAAEKCDNRDKSVQDKSVCDLSDNNNSITFEEALDRTGK